MQGCQPSHHPQRASVLQGPPSLWEWSKAPEGFFSICQQGALVQALSCPLHLGLTKFVRAANPPWRVGDTLITVMSLRRGQPLLTSFPSSDGVLSQSYAWPHSSPILLATRPCNAQTHWHTLCLFLLRVFLVTLIFFRFLLKALLLVKLPFALHRIQAPSGMLPSPFLLLLLPDAALGLWEASSTQPPEQGPPPPFPTVSGLAKPAWRKRLMLCA